MIRLKTLTRQLVIKKFQRYIAFLLALLIIACGFSRGEVTTANSLKQKQIIVKTSTKFTADSFNGVKAIYRKGSSDGSSQTYSCAAFVKRYYKKVYKKTVYNLLYNRKPLVTGGSVKKVSKPQIGDIVAMNTSRSTTHWAIVKAVNPDNTVTLIEQNWKWTIRGKTYTVINRKIKISSARFYRLNSVKTTVSDDSAADDSISDDSVADDSI